MSYIALRDTFYSPANRLSAAVLRTLSHEELPEQTMTKLWRRTLNSLATAFSAIGMIPLVGANAQAAEILGAKWLAIPLITCNNLGFFGLKMLGLTEIINDWLSIEGKEDQELSKITKPGKALILLISAVAGVASQIPIAVLAYESNKVTPLIPGSDPIMYPIIILASDSTITTYSVYGMLKGMAEKQLFSPVEAKLDTIKNRLADLLESQRTRFAKMDESERADYLKRIYEIQDESNTELRLAQFIDLFISSDTASQEETISPSLLDKTAHITSGTVGLFLTACQLYLLGSVSFAGSAYISENLDERYAIALISVASIAYLMGHSSIRSLQEGAKSLCDRAKGRHVPPIISQLSPLGYPVQESLGWLCAILSGGPSVTMSAEFIQGRAMQNFFKIASLPTVSLTTGRALSQINRKITAWHINQSGTPEEKRVLAHDLDLARTESMIRKCSLLNFAKFLREMPPATQQLLFSGAELTQDELSSYLFDKMRPDSSSEADQHSPRSPLLGDTPFDDDLV